MLMTKKGTRCDSCIWVLGYKNQKQRDKYVDGEWEWKNGVCYNNHGNSSLNNSVKVKENQKIVTI